MRRETWILVLTAVVVAIGPACAGGGGPEGTTAEADADHAEAMAREHAGEEPVATPATEGDAAGVAGRAVKIGRASCRERV